MYIVSQGKDSGGKMAPNVRVAHIDTESRPKEDARGRKLDDVRSG